jgi:signal transduction histidine kinase
MRIIVSLLLLFCSLPVLIAQENNNIQLLRSVNTTLSDSTKISLNLKIAKAYFEVENDSSIYYYKKALEIVERLNSKQKKAKILFDIGYNYETFHNHQQAIQYYKHSKIIFEELNDSINVALLNNYLGYCYTHVFNETKAIEFYLKALSIYKNLKNDIGIANCYTDIGNLYYTQENYEVAKNYYRDALNLYKKLNQLDGEANSYTNLGNVLIDEGKVEIGLDYFEKAIKIYKVQNNLRGLALVYNNIADSYLKQKKFNKSKEIFNKALQITKQLNDKDLESLVLLNLSDLLNNTANFNEAITKANQSNSIISKTGNLDYKVLNFMNLAVAYDGLGKSSEAIKYYKKHIQLKDSLNKIEGNKKTQLFNALSKLEEKEFTIESLAAKNEITQLKYNNEKKISYFLIGTIVIFAFLIVLFIYEQESKKKAYNLLEYKNYQINKMNTEIQTQRDNLRQLNSTKNKFFSIIAHDLKNPFNSIKGFTELLIENKGEYDEEKQLKFLKIIKGSTVKASSLLNNLLIWANTQTGNIKFTPININLSLHLLNVISLLEIQAFNKNIQIDNKLDSKVLVHADENMLSTILRNLISNAIKFTMPNGTIEITSKQLNDFVEISIKDSGIGMSNSEVESLFNIETKKSTLGTSNEQGSGLGLILCKEFVEKHNGSISVKSEENKGSIFSFTLPNWVNLPEETQSIKKTKKKFLVLK